MRPLSVRQWRVSIQGFGLVVSVFERNGYRHWFYIGSRVLNRWAAR